MDHDTDRRIAEGALFTDQYQLSMAQVYFDTGLHERRARFDYVFRTYPDYGRHQAGYCVFAGLGDLLEWMAATRFTAPDLDVMRSRRTPSGGPVFGDEFLGWLEGAGGFDRIEIDAVAEGRVVHAGAPLLTVHGPLAMAQILETSLLNHLNYPTLVATKASRVAATGRGSPVLEFGMRRGPGLGVNAGARAALIGGADHSSNVGISHVVGVSPSGTHAHSLVQVFTALGAGELEAFRAVAARSPDDCVLLVDTIDTLASGVPNAITVFEELRRSGHEPRGIRLDSGDLAHLAIRAARMLDDAGFPDAAIVLSSDLDELAMWQILAQISEEAEGYGVSADRLAARLVYGVGTRLITSHGHGALDGVYKLVAVDDDAGSTRPAIKISDSPAKIPIPGEKRLWRLYDGRGVATADVVAGPDERIVAGAPVRLHHVSRPDVAREVVPSAVEELLAPVWRRGTAAAESGVEAGRRRRIADLERLDPGVRRLVNPHVYHVSLTTAVHDLRIRLIEEPRGS